MEAAKYTGTGYSAMSNSAAAYTECSRVVNHSGSRPYILSPKQNWTWAQRKSIADPAKPARMRIKTPIIRCGKDGEEIGDMNRRRLLLASTSAVGLAGLHMNVGAEKGTSLPMPPPDLSLCHKPDLPAGVASVNCCPPYSETAIDFQFPTNLPVRIRQAAHLVDEEYIDKYSRAVQLMKQLPPDDPRSFTQQANVHCAYCDGAYYTGSLQVELDVHSSWFFLPWHRWYLYFHERILAKLIADDSFAVPFWNWDNPHGFTIPPMYVNKEPLHDPLRDAAHQPPTPVDLNFDGTDIKRTLDELIASNNTLMYRQIVSNAKTASLFQGSAFRYGDKSDPGAGTLENAPHNTVHRWTGDRTQPNGEDMGTFYSAARDPIFFAHHSNVDRIWTIWKTLGGGRKDYTDKDFLDSKFLFYDENAKLMRVNVADALDPTRLRFSYERVDIPWLNARPAPFKKTRTIATTTTTRKHSMVAGVPEAALASPDHHRHADIHEEFGSEAKQLVAPLHVRVKRANAKLRRQIHGKEEAEEVLLIEGIEVRRDRAMKFDVFINLPEADSTTSIAFAEFAGTFVNVPHHDRKQEVASERRKKKGSAEPAYRKSSLRIGISEILEDVGANEDESIIVTLIPKGDIRDPISISGIKIIHG